MIGGVFDIRAFEALREEINQELEDYPARMDSVSAWENFIGERERFRTFQVVLQMMEGIQERLLNQKDLG